MQFRELNLEDIVNNDNIITLDDNENEVTTSIRKGNYICSCLNNNFM